MGIYRRVRLNNKNEIKGGLKKHVGAIHSSNSISLLQRKIANALLYNAYQELLSKEEHTIQIIDLCKLVGFKSNNQQKVKSSLTALISTVIEWNIIGASDVEEWNASSIISSASIKSGSCTYAYSPVMRKLLHHPEMYGKLDMSVQASFSSSYGLALYENCARFLSIRKTPWLEIDNFRKLMGVEPNKYTIFRDFKRRVIDKAVDEVNIHADFTVEVEYKKEKKAVSKIRFLITNKTFVQRLSNLNSSFVEQMVEEFGLTLKKAKEYINDYGEDYIKEKIDIIRNQKTYKNGTIKHPSLYLDKAIKDNFKPEKQKAPTPKVVDFDPKEEILQKEKAKKMKQRLINNYQILINHDPNEEQQDKEEFLTSFKSQPLYQLFWKNGGFDHPAVSVAFHTFLKNKYPELVEEDQTV